MNEITTLATAQPQHVQPISAQLVADFVDFIDRSPATTRAYLTNLRQFLQWLQANGITRPGRADVVRFREDLTDKGCKPNTITAYIRSVKQFFEWTASAGIYPNIAANVHTPKVNHTEHKKDAFAASEVVTIETAIKEKAAEKAAAAANAKRDTAGRVQRSTEQGKRLYAMFLLAVNTGLRTVEISRANILDLETRNGQTWLYIWGKGHTEPDQKKPLAPEVVQAIQNYLATREGVTSAAPLFTSTGNRSKGKRIAPTTISTMLKQAMQTAGFDSERLTAHSLRHTAGTAVMNCTGDIYQTQKYMRHASPATTEIYLHVDTERQEVETAKRLFAFYHSATAEKATGATAY